MGREVRRVPLDFDWPINETWEGFLNPHYKGHCFECPDCQGSGYSEFAKELKDLWYGNLPFKPEDNGRTPYEPSHQLIQALAKRNIDHCIESINKAPNPRDRFDFSGEKARESFRRDYGFDISTDPEYATQLEARRLANLYNDKWCYHLSDEDVQALLDDDDLFDFTRRKLREVTEDDIRTHAYYLWIEAGCPEGDGVEFWEKSVEEHDRYWLPYSNGYRPTADEVNLYNITSIGGSSQSWALIKYRCKKAGKSHLCNRCEGSGHYWDSEENEKRYEEWEPTDPPTGEAYQIWETVSEGSPISPPFADPKDLAEYMAEHPWGADHDVTAEQWLKFILGPGWAPSLIATPETGVVSGVVGVVENV
jgi:hypothetical protein